MAAVDSFELLYREIARSCNSCVETLAVVGALYTASKAFILVRDCYSFVRVHFLPRLMPSVRLGRRFGEWAVIYGASEAIGKAYAEELARQGICIILISQDGASVSDTAKAISETHRVDTMVLVADFSQGHAACKPVKDALRDKDIGFLVNCVDDSLRNSPNFTGLSEDLLWDVINRNIAATTLMTRLVLPGMVERRRGAVVNISSGACYRPSPSKAALSASTAYLDNFSRALHHEYGRQGIFVQSLVPFQVAPHGASAGGWLIPQSDVYARHAISTLGISHRTTGYWPHTLQFRLVQSMPEWIWVLGSRMLTSSC
ncbi:inactive hydroxysteroid dehydrogenase-like protein 1 [Salmo trutta]|uniref:Hydroxysteroid dehydrogenase like 1 n=1 Tax=Salmo trutta TaxID=8032 RepID=A0A673Y9I1_SALTR|nr:inactive hydroxysteroid dehydrogenase-like protein 1 [Salmo trutta]